MKTSLVRKIALLAPFVFPIFSAFATSPALNAILKERDETLPKIFEWQKAAQKQGAAENPAAVFLAEAAPYSFRRDAAPVVEEKIKNQQLIVAAYDRREEELKSRAAAGLMNPLEALRARDEQLQAKPKLEQLKG